MRTAATGWPAAPVCSRAQTEVQRSASVAEVLNVTDSLPPTAVLGHSEEDSCLQLPNVLPSVYAEPN